MKKKSFEEALAELEQITKVLEEGDLSLEEGEKALITKALRATNGNRTRAAELLGVSRRTLHRKLNEYNLRDT